MVSEELCSCIVWLL